METQVFDRCRLVGVVLIVPCGMETITLSGQRTSLHRINCTLRNGNIRERRRKNQSEQVLIVPCGMETWLKSWDISTTKVLIVPCGMETVSWNFGKPWTAGY